ncbi:MAG: inositol monophosphatase family protein [Candidatus Fimadaptatus sp.]
MDTKVDDRGCVAAMELLLEKIEGVARRAARIMLDAVASPAHAKEGHYNFVTDADVQVQNMLITELSALLPGAEFFAEEKENQRLTAADTFIIDPIDGTLNFMRARRCSAISIALMRGREPVLGLVYDPYADEMFTALKGRGACLNGRPIRASHMPFERAMVAMGTSPYYAELSRRTMDIACDFLRQAGDLRRIGSAALDLCCVACGRSDVYYELKLSPWDFAAGALIAAEAGARFELIEGGKVGAREFGAPGCVLAANQECFERALEVLAAHC